MTFSLVSADSRSKLAYSLEPTTGGVYWYLALGLWTRGVHWHLARSLQTVGVYWTKGVHWHLAWSVWPGGVKPEYDPLHGLLVHPTLAVWQVHFFLLA